MENNFIKCVYMYKEQFSTSVSSFVKCNYVYTCFEVLIVSHLISHEKSIQLNSAHEFRQS